MEKKAETFWIEVGKGIARALWLGVWSFIYTFMIVAFFADRLSKEEIANLLAFGFLTLFAGFLYDEIPAVLRSVAKWIFGLFKKIGDSD